MSNVPYWLDPGYTPCQFATGGRILPGDRRPDGVPAMLSPGCGIVSRRQADTVGIAALRNVGGAPYDILILEPDGTLTEVPHDQEA